MNTIPIVNSLKTINILKTSLYLMNERLFKGQISHSEHDTIDNQECGCPIIGSACWVANLKVGNKLNACILI